MPRKFVLAVTTYNRLARLKRFMQSFESTRNPDIEWHVVIADDGSTDGTQSYISNLQNERGDIQLITNNRKGVHHQFNTIVELIKDLPFDLCFKCDDDIEFLKSGWETTYFKAVKESGYGHLCHFNLGWRPHKNRTNSVKRNELISYCQLQDVQGAFFTLTPEMITDIGYMDTVHFGFRGVGHIDYTARACRRGYNHIDHPFDVVNSNKFIGHQSSGYTSALNSHIQNALERDEETLRKYNLVRDSSRIYIPFLKNPPSLTRELEYELLQKRLDILEREKNWYEKTYGYQPRWFVRIGKLFNKIGLFR